MFKKVYLKRINSYNGNIIHAGYFESSLFHILMKLYTYEGEINL